MKKFMLLYKGPTTPPGASHDKWPAWFKKMGDKLVDIGSPMENGLVLNSDGSTNDSPTNLNGYSIVQAKDINEVQRLVKDHPFLAFGNGEYCVEIFALPKA